MDHYANYTLRDFIQDDLFIRWVKYPDPDSTRYWESVRDAHPHLSSVMDHAAGLVNAFSNFYPNVPDSEIEKGRQVILGRYERERVIPFDRRRLYISVAASVLVLLGIALWIRPNVTSVRFIKQSLTQRKDDIQTSNEGTTARVISLSDGSTITLSPRSSVRCELKSDSRREVYLEGEAFFNVTKNPDKPFYVYSNGLITKVLGTRFKVLAYPNGKVVKVEVTSGRVRVYSATAGAGHEESGGLTLTPNQEAIYNIKDQQLTRTVVEQPKVLITPEQLKTYTYTDTPISKIFEGLEDIYGIKVVYDKEKFKNCRLNMSLSDESLFEKLELIGKVVEARYNVIDGQVIFIGDGCSE